MQNLFNFENVYIFALQVGITLVGLLIVSYVVCWIGQWVWAWLDDGKAGSVNLLTKLLRVTKSKYRYFVTDFDGEKNYYLSDAKEDEGKQKDKDKLVGKLRRTSQVKRLCDGGLIAYYAFGFIIVPQSLAVIYSNFHLSLCIAGFFAVAFVTRAGRRGQKILTAHIEDKALHSTTSKRPAS